MEIFFGILEFLAGIFGSLDSLVRRNRNKKGETGVNTNQNGKKKVIERKTKKA